jgi:acyl-CoA thioesterase FadM
VCTVIGAYNSKGAAAGGQARWWFASVSLKVEYLAPTPMDRPLTLRARIREMGEKKALVSCTVVSGDQETARGEVVAVRVPAWAGPGARA